MSIQFPYCKTDAGNPAGTLNNGCNPAGKSPFKSFWMAGFECADQVNAFGNRVDLLQATGHLQLIDEDYKNLNAFKISTVREGIRWSQVERKPFEFDWSSVKKMLLSAKQNNMQQLWDLCHFGFPDDLTPLHPMFPRRFAALCKSFALFHKSENPDATLIVTPINEVSFISWLGGEVRGTVPFCVGQGWEVKYRLMKAYIEGIEALKEVNPDTIILITEPLVNIAPPLNATEEQLNSAAQYHEEQFQVIDILCGKMCPELRGQPAYLDILGFNYYHNNQWVKETNEFLCWKSGAEDKRWIPLHKLMIDAYYRYNRPIVLTETSHPQDDRAEWIAGITDECRHILQQGIPLWGICWYPIINRPDWDHLDIWHKSGLWDGEYYDEGLYARILHTPLAESLLKSQVLLSDYIKS